MISVKNWHGREINNSHYEFDSECLRGSRRVGEWFFTVTRTDVNKTPRLIDALELQADLYQDISANLNYNRRRLGNPYKRQKLYLRQCCILRG